MKKSKIVLIILAVAIFISLSVSCFISPKIDYAYLVPKAEGRSYIMLNGTTKYCYMMYYGSNYKFDQKLREGKNIILSQFLEGFETCSSDTEKNFIHCSQGILGYQTYGLYVKESYIDELFKLSNISYIEIEDDNGNQILKFKPKDQKIYSYFLKTYSKELNNLYYLVDDTSSLEITDGYTIFVYYQNGEIFRVLRLVDKDAVLDFEKLLK